MKLLFATQNQHKRDEVQAIMGDVVEIISLKDLDFLEELPETHSTLMENAAEKAEFIYALFHQNCFAEDTGLEVEALNGEPGVMSARYAGPAKHAADNIQLVLEKLKGLGNRKARFRTVVCLVIGGAQYFFEGIVNGSISTVPEGKSGFGYDPVFIPDGSNKTFAEMEADEKNRISHRSKAILEMKEFITSGNVFL